MSLTLITGPMFSGKSSLLISYMNKYTIIKKKVLAINHSFDKRYNEKGYITTHDGKLSNQPNLIFNVSLNEFKDLNLDDIKEYEAIFIDEGQFFGDINEMVDYFLKHKKDVYMSFLNADYKMESFKVMDQMYAKADKIIHLTAYCMVCGEPAPFTKRLIKSEEQVLIGSQDAYEPRCRKHF